MTQEEIYGNFIKDICELVNKNKRLGVFLKNISFYGIHKDNNENVYKITLVDDEREVIIYAKENCFKGGGSVPWSGNRKFRPADFDDGTDERKLILTGCGCIYKYCKHGIYCTPPEIKK